MKILYLDCFAGISGDMTLGALVDLGLSIQDLERELAKLHLAGYRLEVSRVDKRGVQATQLKVILLDDGNEHLADIEYDEDHKHEQEYEPEPGHAHHSPISHTPAQLPADSSVHHTPHRSLREIIAIIEGSGLSDDVKMLARRIFRRLGEAEAAVHGISVDDVYFHEVGGVDAIVDIVGTAIGVHALGVRHVVASPLHLGTGTIHMAHGLYPIPAPATAQLVQGFPVYTTEAKGELVTPTGAAIVTTLAQEFGPIPLMKVARVGYGAGMRDREFPNVLRAFLGETPEAPIASSPSVAVRSSREPNPQQHDAPTTEGGYHEGKAIAIEATIDDMNPQLYEELVEHLLAAGALDVVLLPVQMKKQRPGVLVQVLAASEGVGSLLPILFTESTTLGVRTYEVSRYMLQREVHTVQTRYGTVRVKVARLGDGVVNFAPEYEDCRDLAHQQHVPVKLVYSAALGAATVQDW